MMDFNRACMLDEGDLEGNPEDISHLTEYERYCWLMKTHVFAQRKDYLERRDDYCGVYFKDIWLKFMIAIPCIVMLILVFFNADIGISESTYNIIFPICAITAFIFALILRQTIPAGRLEFFRRHGVTHVREFDKRGVEIPYNDLVKKVFKYTTDEQVKRYRNYRQGYYIVEREFPWPDEE